MWDFVGGTVKPPRGTFAARPAFGTAGRVYIVTDALTAGDCDAGGGTEEALCYDDGAAWVAIGGGGAGGGDSFVTWDVPSGTDPVADSATDTIIFTCTAPVTCTGDSATDTLTLAIGATPTPFPTFGATYTPGTTWTPGPTWTPMATACGGGNVVQGLTNVHGIQCTALPAAVATWTPGPTWTPGATQTHWPTASPTPTETWVAETATPTPEPTESPPVYMPSEIPTPGAIAIFPGTDPQTVEPAQCTIVDDAIDCPAHATEGGCLTLKEGADDGTNTVKLCVSDTGIATGEDAKYLQPAVISQGFLHVQTPTGSSPKVGQMDILADPLPGANGGLGATMPTCATVQRLRCDGTSCYCQDVLTPVPSVTPVSTACVAGAAVQGVTNVEGITCVTLPTPQTTATPYNPSDCSAGKYAQFIDSDGNLLCSEVIVQPAFDLYVDKNGTDGAACGSVVNPCLTITGANGAHAKIAANNDNGYAVCKSLTTENFAQGCGRCSNDVNTSCNENNDCSGIGICTYLSCGNICVGGANAGAACSVDSECPGGACTDLGGAEPCAFTCAVTKRCVGGANATKTCTNSSECPSSSCAAAHCLDDTDCLPRDTCGAEPNSTCTNANAACNAFPVQNSTCIAADNNFPWCAGSTKHYVIHLGPGTYSECLNGANKPPGPGYIGYVCGGSLGTCAINCTDASAKTCFGGANVGATCTVDSQCPGSDCAYIIAHDMSERQTITFRDTSMTASNDIIALGSRGNGAFSFNSSSAPGATIGKGDGPAPNLSIRGRGHVSNSWVQTAQIFGGNNGVYIESWPPSICVGDATHPCNVPTNDAAGWANGDAQCAAGGDGQCSWWTCDNDRSRACSKDTDCTAAGHCRAAFSVVRADMAGGGAYDMWAALGDTLVQVGSEDTTASTAVDFKGMAGGAALNIGVRNVEILVGDDGSATSTGIRLSEGTCDSSGGSDCTENTAVSVRNVRIGGVLGFDHDRSIDIGTDTRLEVLTTFDYDASKRVVNGVLTYSSEDTNNRSGGDTDLGNQPTAVPTPVGGTKPGYGEHWYDLVANTFRFNENGTIKEAPSHTHQSVAEGGQLDHGAALTGLTDDDHPQYVIAAGASCANGQPHDNQETIGPICTNNTDVTLKLATSGSGIVVGGAAAGNDLYFQPTTHGTEGQMYFCAASGSPSTDMLDCNGTNTLTLPAIVAGSSLKVGSTDVVLTSRTLTGGAGIATIGDLSANRTITVDSTEAAFLTDGGTTDLTCGAANQGKAQVMDDGTIQVCDGAATSLRRVIGSQTLAAASTTAAVNLGVTGFSYFNSYVGAYVAGIVLTRPGVLQNMRCLRGTAIPSGAANLEEVWVNNATGNVSCGFIAAADCTGSGTPVPCCTGSGAGATCSTTVCTNTGTTFTVAAGDNVAFRNTVAAGSPGSSTLACSIDYLATK